MLISIFYSHHLVHPINYIILNGASGSCVSRNWNVFAGTSVNTQIRGKYNVPFGNITTSDFFYGSSENSLTTALSKLSNVANTSPSGLPVSAATATALNNKLNKADPTYTGVLSDVNNNFQVDTLGTVNCLDVITHDGLSLTVALANLSNVANISPSALPISTATQTALNGKWNMHLQHTQVSYQTTLALFKSIAQELQIV